jgi:hypothetical protein
VWNDIDENLKYFFSSAFKKKLKIDFMHRRILAFYTWNDTALFAYLPKDGFSGAHPPPKKYFSTPQINCTLPNKNVHPPVPAKI